MDGGWGEWSRWLTKCTRTCGGGVQFRFRQCDSPSPSAGGADCPGNPTESSVCNKDPCESLKSLSVYKPTVQVSVQWMDAGQNGLTGHYVTFKQELRGEREIAPSQVRLMVVGTVRARILKYKNVLQVH